MAGFLSRAVERSCPECSAHVPATSRFCPECQRFVRGGPSDTRAVAVITTIVEIPLAVALIVFFEIVVAFFGVLGIAVALALAWWFDKSHPSHSDTLSIVILGIHAVFIIGVIAYWLIVG